jgi:hypothetical protein
MDIDILSNDRRIVKKALIRGMSRAAEEVEEWYESGSIFTNVHFFGDCPKAFHPSSGDKLIFGMIIDSVLDNIMSEDRTNTNEAIAGMAILDKFYYPYYT